jgi:hypothetical protein
MPRRPRPAARIGAAFPEPSIHRRPRSRSRPGSRRLGSWPRCRASAAERSIAYRPSTPSPAAEAFRTIRTNIEFAASIVIADDRRDECHLRRGQDRRGEQPGHAFAHTGSPSSFTRTASPGDARRSACRTTDRPTSSETTDHRRPAD